MNFSNLTWPQVVVVLGTGALMLAALHVLNDAKLAALLGAVGTVAGTLTRTKQDLGAGQ